MDLKKLDFSELELAEPNADYAGTQTILIDFDGANSVSYDNDALDITINNIDVKDSGLTEEQQFQIITDLNNTFANTGVSFTTEVTENTESSTIYVGASALSELGNFAGLAETIDAGNQIKNDEAFVFSDKLDSLDSVTEAIAHEAGHLLGFAHAGDSVIDQLNDFAAISILDDNSIKITASDGAESDIFGYSVSVSGETIVVGAYYSRSAYVYKWNGSSYDESILSTGIYTYGQTASISGNTIILSAFGDDGNVVDSGTAYVYRWNGTSYDEHKLFASDGALADWFGRSVAISGDTIVVGADGDDDNGDFTGSAYVYRWDGLNYTEYKLTASDGAERYWFGKNVSVFGDTIAISANGAENNDIVSGRVYLYSWNGSSYDENILSGSSPELHDSFGSSVAIYEDIVVVGSTGDRNNGLTTGCAYVYRKNGSSYDEFKLSDPDGNIADSFGGSISVFGDFVIVGAYGVDDTVSNSGRAYLYHWNGSSYDNTIQIDPITKGENYYFGRSVAISGDTIVIGSTGETENTGSVYVYSLAELTSDETAEDSTGLNFTVDGDDVTLDWANPSAASKYQIQIDNNNDFSSVEFDAESIDSKIISFGLSDDTYFWRVRAYAGGEYGDWVGSDFIFDSISPSIPSGLTDLVNRQSAVLDWADSTDDGSGLKEYVVEIADNFDFTGAVSETVTNSTLALSGLANDVYYWRVKAADNEDNVSEWSSADSFMVNYSLLPDGQLKLSASDGVTADYFGCSIAVSGDYIIVGADADDDNGNDSGSAYLYHWNGISYGEQKIIASNGISSDHFGFSVDMSGENIITSAHCNDAGTAYVYRWNGTSYDEIELSASDGEAGDQFGISVSISGNTAVVGAYMNDAADINSGSAYVYKWNGTTYDETKLTASDGAANDYFGVSVDMSGDDIIVGSMSDDGNANNSGSAYVYRWNGTTYDETRLIASDGIEQSLNDFGCSVAIDGDNVVVGALNSRSAYVYRWNGGSYDEIKLIAEDEPNKYGWSVDIDGDFVAVGAVGGDENGFESGSVYLYRWNGSAYAEYKLSAPDGAASDWFGFSVSIDNDTLVVGAFRDNDKGVESGTSYVFDLNEIDFIDPPTGLTDSTDRENAFLDWTDSVGAAEYIVQYDNENSFTDPSSETVSVSEFDLNSLSRGTYYWRVKAVDDTGNMSAWSTVDSFELLMKTETTKLTASNAAASTFFGKYVDIYDDVVVVGSANGPNAYIYQLQENVWTESNIATPALWVASDGDKTLLGYKIYELNEGTWEYSSSFTPPSGIRSIDVDGNNIIANGTTGAVLYQWDGTVWNETTLLDAETDSISFVNNSAIDGDIIVVGDDGFDGVGENSGRVNVYQWNGSVWEETTLTASDPAGGGRFGHSVAVDGDTIVVGSYFGLNESDVPSGAVYVYNWDGSTWNESKITASDAMPFDYFGYSVAIDGETILVGARGDDDNGPYTGSAYLYQWNGTSYDETKLTASDGESGDYFGLSVALDGNKAVIGAQGDDGNTGAAYVYDLNDILDITAPETPIGLTDDVTDNSVSLDWDDSTDADSGIQEYIVQYADNEQFTDAIPQTVTASELDLGNLDNDTYYWRVQAVDNVGNASDWSTAYSFSIIWDGVTKFVASDGAVDDHFGNSVALAGDTIVVGADYDDDKGNYSGSAYVYSWNGISYDEIKLTASDGSILDFFGRSVAISGENIVVGSTADDDNGHDSGSAYVYRWNETFYDEIKLTASDGLEYDSFGTSVAIDDDNIVVGAFGDGSGSAYVYRWNGTDYDETRLTASDGDEGDRFGYSVAIDGDNIVVGACVDDDNGFISGSAYVYRWNGTSYDETKLTASDGDEGDRFGDTVAIDGDNIVVGAYGDDDNGIDSGSAYVYRWNGLTYDEIKLTASDGELDDRFGNSIAIDDDYIVVGVSYDDDNGSNSGSAYLYHWNGTGYDEIKKIIASDGAENDEFGTSVSIDDNNIVIGARYDDDNGDDSGSAYVFDLDIVTDITVPSIPLGLIDDVTGNSVALDWDDSTDADSGIKEYIVQYADNDQFTDAIPQTVTASELDLSDLAGGTYYWRVKSVDNNDNESSWSTADSFEVDTFETKLTASNGAASAFFGKDVDIYDDMVVVGSAIGTNGPNAYIYQLQENVWTESNIATPALWVASDGDKTLLGYKIYELNEGTWEYSSSFTPPSGIRSIDVDGNNIIANGTTGAVLYQWDGTVWNETTLLDAETDSISFVNNSAIDGDIIVVGDDGFDGVGENSGRVNVYQWNGSVWEETTLTASDPAGGGRFGHSVAVDGDTIVVGSYFGLNESDVPSGAVYVYNWDGSTWNESKITASDAMPFDYFGYSVAIDGETILVGARGDDDNGPYTGSAYLYQWNGTSYDETKLTASDGESGDYFGLSVALDGNKAVIGAQGDDGNTGAAYVYDLNDILDITAPETPIGLTDDVTDNSVSLDWDDSTDADSGIQEYIVQYADNEQFTDAIPQTVTASELDLGNLDNDTYYWRVQAVDNVGNASDWSTAYSFSIIWDGVTKFVASDGAVDDHFGNSVALAGDTIVVGADYDDDKGNYSGSAYVYSWNGISYDEIKLTASDGSILDFFGRSVAISGENIVVGSTADDDNGHDSGSAYVYRWNETFYDEIKLTASDGLEYDSFGTSVAIDDDNIVVGAFGDGSGSAYVYRWNGTDYDETRLTASDGDEGDRFGYSVAIDGDNIVVGACVDDDNGFISGSAYVYRWNGTSYDETKLTASDGDEGDRFGDTVAIDGDNIVVGAYGDDDNGIDSGSAYVYRWNGLTYDEIKLTASDGELDDRFGNSIAIDDDYIVVGVSYDDDNGSNSGSAYLYHWNGTGYDEIKKIIASDGAENDEFGTSVSIDDNNIVIGARYDDDNGDDSGSAYVFDLDIVTDITVPSIPLGLIDDVTGNSVALDWDDSTDADSGIKEYIVQYADNDQFTDAIPQTVTASELDLSDLAGGTYYWRVKSVDNNDNESSWSTADSFEVDTFETKLTASNGAASAFFGKDVDIYDDMVVVGSAIGTNGPNAYIYQLQENVWTESNIATPALWVASDGDKTLLGYKIYELNEGTWEYSSSFTPPSGIRSIDVDGNNIIANGTTGAVLYQWDGTVWNETTLLDAETDSISFVNNSAIDGDIIVVGDDGFDGVGENSGRVNVYQWNGSVWEETTLTASDPAGGGRFGHSVAVDGDTIVVGSYFGLNESDVPSGAVYVYNWDGSTWNESKITASDAMPFDYFGYSVAIDGETILVGARGDDDNGSMSGSAYLYQWNGTSYDETKLTASDGEDGDSFGYSVALNGSKAVIGAQGDDDDGASSGSAYVYDLSDIVDLTAPSVPDGLTDSIDEDKASLDWTDATDSDSGINKYTVQYADNDQFTDALSQTATISELDLSDLDNGTYYWRVKAVDNNDNASAWSETDSFTIEDFSYPVNDFDGNGCSDILWQRDDGKLYTWDDGQLVNDWNYAGSIPADFIFVGTGDFDGNGQSDILWQRNNMLYSWADGNVAANGWTPMGGAPDIFTLLDTGDFDGNGKDDILWKRDDGKLYIWADGKLANGWIYAGGISDEFTFVGVADFDGNGQSDILWERNNVLYSWADGDVAANGWTPLGGAPDNFELIGTGDFDGNGKTDILWQRDDGILYIWNDGTLAGGWDFAGNISSDFNFVGTGDYDGNGKNDILWERDNVLYSWADGDVAANGWTPLGAAPDNFTILNSTEDTTAPTIPVDYILVVNGNSITSDWEDASDESGIKLYQIQGSFYDDFREGEDTVDLTSETSNITVNNLEEGDYFWRIRAIDNNNNMSEWSEVGNFTIESAPCPPNDFDGNGKSDILWQRDDGKLYIWDDGNLANNWDYTGSISNEFSFVGTADFDGNGQSDILWKRGNMLYSWADANVMAKGWTPMGGAPDSFEILGTGDFDDNGKDDILWQRDDGKLYIWNDGKLANGWNYAGSISSGFDFMGTADFDGNGKDDILWQRENGSLYAWTDGDVAANGWTLLGGTPDNFELLGTGDFDGNGKDDMLWQRSDGKLYVWDDGKLANGWNYAGSIATDFAFVATGDYDGNGQSDILWERANVLYSWADGDVSANGWTRLGAAPDNFTLLSNIA